MLEFLSGILFTLIGFDYKNKRAKDRELLKLFLNILPSDSDSVLFLKEHDMADTAKFSYFQPLNTIREDWNAPDKEFQVKRIEKRKKAFINKLSEFLSLYAKRSSGGANGTISVGPTEREWDAEMYQYIEQLNKLANEAYDTYKELVRIAYKEI